MPNQLLYRSGLDSTATINLDGDSLYVGTAPEIRSRMWSYTLGAHHLTGLTRNAREASCTLSALDWRTLDKAEQLLDADVAANTPGRLETDSGWACSALAVKSEPQTIGPRLVETNLTIVLLDGVWRKPKSTVLDPETADSSRWLDLPFDLPCDLSSSRPSSKVVNPSLSASPIRLEIPGPVRNPQVTMAGNVYEVDVVVPAGSRLVVDGLAREIYMLSESGERTDCFAAGRRGNGRGGGTYCFEPLPAGVSEANWPSGFTFKLTVYEERSAPPWV